MDVTSAWEEQDVVSGDERPSDCHVTSEFKSLETLAVLRCIGFHAHNFLRGF